MDIREEIDRYIGEMFNRRFEKGSEEFIMLDKCARHFYSIGKNDGIKWLSEQGKTIVGKTYGNPCQPDDFYFTGNVEFWNHLKWHIEQNKDFIVQIREKK